MTKKAKKLFLRSVAALAALTVASCGLLGSTFARYVSTSDGSAVTGIAKWEIVLDGSISTEAMVDKLSPDVNEEFDGGKDRVQTTAGKCALTITNNGDVDAKITVQAVGDLVFYSADENGSLSQYENWGSGFALNENGTVKTVPSQDEANAVIKMEFAYSTDSGTELPGEDQWKSLTEIAADINRQNSSTGIKLSAKSGDAAGGSFYFFVRATWTSQDIYFYGIDQGTAEKMSNLLDTWFGENIVAVGQRITFTALQSSELPTA